VTISTLAFLLHLRGGLVLLLLYLKLFSYYLDNHIIYLDIWRMPC
jgi:hypothetical protein